MQVLGLLKTKKRTISKMSMNYGLCSNELAHEDSLFENSIRMTEYGSVNPTHRRYKSLKE